MPVIDEEYVLKRLPDKRGMRAKLAEFIGIDQPKLTKSLKGLRNFKPQEIHRIQLFFEQLNQIDADPSDPPASGEAAPMHARNRTPEQTLAALSYAATTPELFRATSDMPGFAIASGDLLVVDLARMPQPGELGLIALRDEDARNSTWTVRRWLDGSTLAGTSNARPERLDPNDISVQPRGVIVAVARALVKSSELIEHEDQ